ncbi:MAG: hypothetical protein LUE99_10110 [Bacteroides sp.]|nr:hypothetical protein [Bacteroides sp.]
MGVDAQYGAATLIRFIAKSEIFCSKNGKPLSANTIKEDISEIKKEYLKQPRNKDAKRKSNIK